MRREFFRGRSVLRFLRLRGAESRTAVDEIDSGRDVEPVRRRRADDELFLTARFGTSRRSLQYDRHDQAVL